MPAILSPSMMVVAALRGLVLLSDRSLPGHSPAVERLYVCVRDGCSRGYIGSSPDADIECLHGPTVYRLAVDDEMVLVKCKSPVFCSVRVEVRAPLRTSEPPLCPRHRGNER